MSPDSPFSCLRQCWCSSWERSFPAFAHHCTAGASLVQLLQAKCRLSAAMEWQSFKLGEKLFHFLLPLSALLAFVAFYWTSSYKTMLSIYFLGVIITIVVAVPDWLYFYRTPLSWHQPLGIESSARSQIQSYPRTSVATDSRKSS